jgi:lon-related putative ATP-dependent protease
MSRRLPARPDRRVPPDRLRRVCDPALFPFETSENAPALTDIIAQDRAVEAICFGLNIEEPFFNIFVAGISGTGKTYTVKSFVERHATEQPVPSDWCYIHNFEHPDRPYAVALPAGRAVRLEKDMRELMDLVREEMPKVFDAEDYVRRRNAILADLHGHRDSMVQEVEHEARELGFVVERSDTGLVPVPLHGDRPMTAEEFQALPAEEKALWSDKQKSIQSNLEALLRQVGRLGREARQRLRELDRQVAYYAIRHLFLHLLETYADSPRLQRYFDEVQNDIVERNADFRRRAAGANGNRRRRRQRNPNRYQVNVVVDNSHNHGAPVVLESHPTYSNLFGRLERRARYGMLETDFTMIKPGALHRANGGYLILAARDLLTKPVSWEGLKRALKDHEIKIEDIAEQVGYATSGTVRPEPIPLRAKIILLGDPWLYQLLYHADEDFRELFKVKAHFDSETEWSRERILAYAALVRTRSEQRGLRPFDRTALARLVEFASEKAEDQEKLSTQMSEIDDLLGEANYVAIRSASPLVRRRHVVEAIELRRRRSALVEEKMQEMIRRDILLISTSGSAVGQVNGLSVYDFGDHAFGRPVRITATIALGATGIVDIERKAQLGGRLHTKGVMILAGLLKERFARDKPLALSASLCFEQSYEGVDGDSASSAELYALLSALAGVPARQSLAVTGSVNQKGQIQPIGGVNHKIAGFFDVCRHAGLTGDQGVIIPERNVVHLMLREDIVEAIREGRFHVYAVENVDQGMEILTGLPAGEPAADGRYPAGTVNARVDRTLADLAVRIRRIRRGKPAAKVRPRAGRAAGPRRKGGR